MNPSKKAFRTLLALMAILALAGCATKPPATPQPEPPPPTGPVVEPTPPPTTPAISREELDKLHAEALAQRKRAFDLKLFEVLPDDYKAADAAYVEGKAAYDAADAAPAKASLGKALALFTDLNARGVVEIAALRRKAAEDTRASALKAGADRGAAERFGAGEAAFSAAAALVDAKRHEEAIAGFERARRLFELAWKRTGASELRGRIADGDFAKWDSGNFQLAENKYAEEDILFAAGTAPDADLDRGVDAIDEAVLRYNLVVQKGRQSGATASKERSEESRARSDSIKAAVAVRDSYAAAVSAYEAGAAAFSSGDYEAASARFEEAALGFEESYEAAAAKRLAAEEAMRAAEASAAESERKALEADPLVGTGK